MICAKIGIHGSCAIKKINAQVTRRCPDVCMRSYAWMHTRTYILKEIYLSTGTFKYR